MVGAAKQERENVVELKILKEARRLAASQEAAAEYRWRDWSQTLRG